MGENNNNPLALHRDLDMSLLARTPDRPRRHVHGRLNLWLIPAGRDLSDLALAQGWLNEEELRWATRLIRGEDRALYLNAHAWLRRILADALGLLPGQVRMVRDEWGKPRLQGSLHQRCKFNLSHTEGCIAIAVTDGDEVGVDVEKARRLDDLVEMEGLVLHPDEQARCAALPADGCERAERFLMLWTVKEAYAKAVGRGLRIPFDRLCAEFGSDGVRLSASLPDEGPSSFLYSFQTSWDTPATYIVATATLGRRLPLLVQEPAGLIGV